MHMCSARATLLQAAGVDAAGVGMLGWARSVATSWAWPKLIDGSRRMISTNQKAQKMTDRWEDVIFGFLRPLHSELEIFETI